MFIVEIESFAWITLYMLLNKMCYVDDDDDDELGWDPWWLDRIVKKKLGV